VGAFLPGRFGGKNIAEFTITKDGLKIETIEQVAPLLLITRGGESFPSKGKDLFWKKAIKYTCLPTINLLPIAIISKIKGG